MIPEIGPLDNLTRGANTGSLIQWGIGVTTTKRRPSIMIAALGANLAPRGLLTLGGTTVGIVNP